ncbi:hypothetical protein ATCC90586_001287 [Pythium insidiosum]|nr:hypothetical protein ATCC90586_001287 [Pythium insidiosum]
MPALPTDFVVLRLYDCANSLRQLAFTAAGGACHRSENEALGILRRSGHHRIRRVFVDKPYRHTELLSASGNASGPPPPTSSAIVEFTSRLPWRRSRQPPQPLVDELGVRSLWDKGYKGQGVKVGVFDTGLSNSRFKNVKQRINWTNEKKNEDIVGHGTFVSSIVGGNDNTCPGLAPAAELFAFRTFTTDQLSFTSWFLDAFNYALHVGINVLNLSTGGPDFLDLPFVEKIQELVANGVIVVSAVGNSGPQYGTLTNPADQLEVIGVGGLGRDGNVASFSSRGMTMWELPFGSGRVKPDLVALAEDVPGAEVSRGCKLLSGTSVAAPIVSGTIALLASIIPDPNARWVLLNPAAVKQILLETADRLPSRVDSESFVVQNHIFEQGAGKLNITRATERVEELWRAYVATANSSDTALARATAFPARIDATDCPYMWPLCSHPLFHSSLPLAFNLTILNPTSLSASLVGPPRWVPKNLAGRYVNVSVASPDLLWPHVGSIGVFLEVTAAGASANATARGTLSFSIRDDTTGRQDVVVVPVSVPIVPAPPKSRRILWDQFHNIAYPSAFVPRDSLPSPGDDDAAGDPIDSSGDHPHTNFHQLWNFVHQRGFVVEILPFEYSCLDLALYGVVLLVDPEEEFFADEIAALTRAIKFDNVSLLVFAEWFDPRVLDTLAMYDTSTLSEWHPVTGGANLPALNRLLDEFHMQLAYEIRANRTGVSLLGSSSEFPFASGTYITKFPVGGYLGHIDATNQSAELLNRSTSASNDLQRVPVLGLYEVPARNGGRIAVYGDSACLDASAHQDDTGFRHCFEMLDTLLRFTNDGQRPEQVNASLTHLMTEYDTSGSGESSSREEPNATTTARLGKHSKVLQALQQRPTRQRYCHFHRREQCEDGASIRVTTLRAETAM